MIIIEGVDNSGKTVLGQKLSEFFNYPLIHSPGHCPEMFDWTRKALRDEEIKFYDRFPIISEGIYGPILRDGDDFETEGGKKILNLFWGRRPMVIYCKPPLKIIKKKMGVQMEGVKKNLELLLFSYDEHMNLLRRFGFVVMHYDYTDPQVYVILKLVITAYLAKLEGKETINGKYN